MATSPHVPRTMTTTRTLLGVLAVVSLLPPASAFFLEWGPDLEGPWCATRPLGQQCCLGRDDYCAVPILGTECYCDIFCNDTAYDCCPDYWTYCHGAERRTTTPRPITLPPPRTTKRPLEIVRCDLDGVSYRPGDKVQIDNCNQCTCELEPGQEAVFGMLCTDDVCLIRPDLIQKVNDGPYTWKASNYSALWGMTLNDGIRYRLGTYPLETDVLQMTPIKVRQDESLPEMFDAREKWQGLLHPVRDQGNCGSSWAFSTTAVASDRLSIESEGAIIEELSAQHTLSCDTDGQDGCTGGHVDRAWYFLRKYGVVTEACYPYSSGKTSMEGECGLPIRTRGGDCPSGIAYKKEKRYKASPPYRIRPLEREIMKEIMDNGPVQAIFEVPEDFFMYKSGVYQYTAVTRNDPPKARKSAYHSVRILGWGVERTADGDIIKYWICANSWGPEWGENGYFRIVRGVNANNIENFIIGAWGKITGDVMLRRLLTENRRRRLRERGESEANIARRLRRRRRRHHDSTKKRLRSLLTGRRRQRQMRRARRLDTRRRRPRQGRRGRKERAGSRRGKGEGRRGRRQRKKNRAPSSTPSLLLPPGMGAEQESPVKSGKGGKQWSGRRAPPPPTTPRMPMLEEVIAALEG
ncbi:putative peptidase C1-like protein F26E4.3 [Babylonia areolata]|uniref:putative peptidase C1-like protein F26E4.3 n=1 Tax=Babylonia areolata TaxID=304850 RepID=UPI003FCEF7BC